MLEKVRKLSGDLPILAKVINKDSECSIVWRLPSIFGISQKLCVQFVTPLRSQAAIRLCHCWALTYVGKGVTRWRIKKGLQHRDCDWMRDQHLLLNNLGGCCSDPNSRALVFRWHWIL
jgi:hypothetical protein